MDIQDIDNLTLDPNTGLYNVFDYTFLGVTSISIFSFVLTARHNGRGDLVSLDTYGTDGLMSNIMAINAILSPYCFKSGMIIYYSDFATAQAMNNNSETTSTLSSILINTAKAQRIDQSRTAYNSTQNTRQQANAVSPSTNTNPNNPSVVLQNGIIKINPGL